MSAGGRAPARAALDAGLPAAPVGAGCAPAHRAAAAGPGAIPATVTAGSGRLLRRSGRAINAKRVYRLWCLGGLALPRRRPRRKVRTGARLRPLADRPNAVWTYHFIHDAAANGLRFKCLTVVDEYTRECLAITVDRSLPARRVLEVLGHLVARDGPPQYLRSDNGPEFIARRVRQWLGQTGIVTAYIDPGRPWQNGVGESFHSRFRDECLDREWFHTPHEARVLIEQYRRQYNEGTAPLESRLSDPGGGRRAPCPELLGLTP